MTGRQFPPCPPVSSTNKTDRHDIAEILQKVALTTKNQSMKSINFLKMSSLLGLLINQSINHIYLLIILKLFFQSVVLTTGAQAVLRLVYVIWLKLLIVTM